MKVWYSNHPIFSGPALRRAGRIVKLLEPSRARPAPGDAKAVDAQLCPGRAGPGRAEVRAAVLLAATYYGGRDFPIP